MMTRQSLLSGSVFTLRTDPIGALMPSSLSHWDTLESPPSTRQCSFSRLASTDLHDQRHLVSVTCFQIGRHPHTQQTDVQVFFLLDRNKSEMMHPMGGG